MFYFNYIFAFSENCAIIVEKIYNILKSNNESLVKKDKAVSFGSDLYVQTAELALKVTLYILAIFTVICTCYK